MPTLTSDVIAEFEDITNYPLSTFISDFNSFSENEYPNIVNFYSGITDQVNSQSFVLLQTLQSEIDKIINIAKQFNDRLNNFKFWLLIDYFDEVKTKLDVIENSPKFLRSSVNKNTYGNTSIVDYTIKQGQSLEDISSTVVGSTDFNNDWTEIALKNKLREEDYTQEGGTPLKIELQNSNSIRLNSVIDVMDSSEKVYGLDIKKKLTFSDNDLQTLGYYDTFVQAAIINSQLRMGDDPQFPEDGIDERITVGSNFASFSFPIIFRKMASVFAKDDTFKDFTITRIDRQSEAFYLDFLAKSRVGDFSEQQIKI